MTFRRVAFRADFAYILCTVAKDVVTRQAPKILEQSANGEDKGGNNGQDPTPAFWQELNVNPNG
jgi:hypothetical protein